MQNILIFRTGQIGDFVVSLPALWNVRRNFPAARITLLSDVHERKEMVAATQLLSGIGLIDTFDSLQVSRAGRVTLPSAVAAWWRMMRRNGGRFDAVLDLGPFRPQGLGRLRRLFFALAGCRYFGSRTAPQIVDAMIGRVEAEALRLDRISASLTGATMDLDSSVTWSLGLGAAEAGEFGRVCPPPAADRIRVAVCCGSKVPAKRWPVARYVEVLRRLDAEFPLEVLVFGGQAEQADAAQVVQALPSARNLCGQLSPRASAFGIAACDLYLGNDTGPMHFAAAAGRPCVAVFSARDKPGGWWPHGDQHRIIWRNVACCGCLIFECVQERLKCLTGIHVEEVHAACVDVLRRLTAIRAVVGRGSRPIHGAA